MFKRLCGRFALTLRRRPLLPFLLAATLAVDLVIALSPIGDRPETRLPAAFSQIGLLGVWAGQLRRGWAMRCVLAVAAAVLVCVGLFAIADGPPIDEVLSVVLCYGAGIAAVGATTKLAGRVFARLRRGGSAEPVQFSIVNILVATTLVAVGLALLRFANFPGDFAEVVIGCSLLGALPLVAEQIVRRATSRWLAAVGVLAASAVCGWGFIESVVRGSDRVWWFVSTLLQGAFYLVWLLGLRVRLHKPASSTPPAPRPNAVAAEPVSQSSPVEETAQAAPLDLEG